MARRTRHRHRPPRLVEARHPCQVRLECGRISIFDPDVLRQGWVTEVSVFDHRTRTGRAWRPRADARETPTRSSPSPRPVPPSSPVASSSDGPSTRCLASADGRAMLSRRGDWHSPPPARSPILAASRRRRTLAKFRNRLDARKLGRCELREPQLDHARRRLKHVGFALVCPRPARSDEARDRVAILDLDSAEAGPANTAHTARAATATADTSDLRIPPPFTPIDGRVYACSRLASKRSPLLRPA